MSKEHSEALQALRDAVQEGLDSGPPVPFDLQGILSEAKARKLQEHDPVVERWLVDVVGPTLDRHRANPSEARPIDEAMADLDAMMSADALPDLSE
jgi:hypothetical protein